VSGRAQDCSGEVPKMAEVECSDNQVIIRIPKAILIFTREQFIKALRHGKVYRGAKPTSDGNISTRNTNESSLLLMTTR
jgi:hypothetical protein